MATLSFLQHPKFREPETPLLRLLRQHGFHPTSQMSSPRLGGRKQFVFRRSTSSKGLKLSEALMDAFRQAKISAIRALAAR